MEKIFNKNFISLSFIDRPSRFPPKVFLLAWLVATIWVVIVLF